MQSQIVHALSQMGITPMAQRVAMTSSMIAGRLALFQKNWKCISNNPWVINCIMGYAIARLCTDSIPTSSSKGVDLPPWEETEPRLRGPQNVRQACNSIDFQQSSQQGFSLTTFHCLKEKWGYTTLYKPETTKFICTHSLFQNGRHIHAGRPPKTGDWMTKVDLKDTYFIVPIALYHRRLLLFKWQRQTYQFNCLPFGLSSALWVSTKTTHPVSQP